MDCKKLFINAAFTILLFAAMAAASTEANPFVANLVAGQKIIVGTVSVWNDANYLYVTYATSGGWYMTETHLQVAASPDLIPQKNGNPIPGHFANSATYKPPVTAYTYKLALNGYSGISIAAHASVQKLDSKGKVIQQETAWGAGKDFPGKNWATYFLYQPTKAWNLPAASVGYSVYLASGNYYIDSVLSGVPPGYSVHNGTWAGWCVDEQHYIYEGQPYYVTLLSSYDPNLPSYAKSDNWAYVNYIINHKPAGATGMDIQNAIWYFVGNVGVYPADLVSDDIINDALANGKGFVPVSGQVGAVIVDAGPDVQLTFIEVDP